ncbi:GH1 family beta-glucosidase [soil metagenome]
MITFPFPEDFLWGTGSSSFQIEGAAFEDQKGLSIWDQACRDFPDRFSGGASPTVATDFYHRYREDIAQMAELGLKTFRLSIAWPRLFPKGRGELNERGAAFYDAIIDCLLEHGIEPFVDLYHWDLPQTLQDEGGFENPQLIDDFVAYADTCFRRYGDRVKLWSTFNEPSVVAICSYALKLFPPYKEDLSAGLLAAHHLLLMHYAAVKRYRLLGQTGKIGAVIAFVPVYPDSLKKEDREAATRQEDYVCNWWLRPMFKGEYPPSVIVDEEIQRAMPTGYAESLSTAFEPMDFVGINYYYPSRTAYCPDSFLQSKSVQVFYAQSDYGFAIYPPGLYDSLNYIRKEYGNPEVYLTENGLGSDRATSLDDELADAKRIEFLQEHLRQLSRAIRSGCNVRGYYYWSHFDDFEGDRGYDINFGLLHVDRVTMERTPRQSWHYYKRCIETNLVA